MKNFRFHPEADIELLEQRDYYDLKEPGLGKGFVLLVYKSIADICAMPHSFPKKYGVQHCYMQVFPFDIVFEEFDTEIVIWAIAHTSRLPGYYRMRIREGL